MNFEPQKFFIGLMDFFTILLPGALLTYLLMDRFGPFMLGQTSYNKITSSSNGAAFAAFFFTSYLFGHLVFLLGSWLDEFYEKARNYTLNNQIANLARNHRLLPLVFRVLIGLVFKQERNLAVEKAARIKCLALEPLGAENAINTFQWCKALLIGESQAHLAVIQRFEADSKFFRSLSVVLLILLVVWQPESGWRLENVLFMLGLLLVALWRYMDQRLKATNQAYWSVITFTAQRSKDSFKKALPTPHEPTHAGGVLYQLKGGMPNYLLVEDKNKPEIWVLPKSRIEDTERRNVQETAVRAVLEESGFWGDIRGHVGTDSYREKIDHVKVTYYLMEVVGWGVKKTRGRRRVWTTYEKALERLTSTESKKILERAHALWKEMDR